MEPGKKVTSKTYPEEGMGIIISVNSFFEQSYCDVQFSNKKIITIVAEDLVPVPEIENLLVNGDYSSAGIFLCRHLINKIDCLLTEDELIAPMNFKIQPLPHQLLTVDFVLNCYRPRCIIADEVGLGKTIEAILVYEELKLRGLAKKVLIVVPSGLMLQWQEELRLKFNEKFVMYDKNYIRNLKQTHGEECNVWKYHDQIIASIDTIKPYRINSESDKREREQREWHNQEVFETIKTAGFDIIFFDEAHKLTKKSDGTSSGRYKLAKQLSEVIPIVVLLTATPHQGDEDMFLNLLRVVDPVTFLNKDSLVAEKVREVIVRNQKRAVIDFEGNRIFKHRITSLVRVSRSAEKNKQEIRLYELITSYVRKYYDLARRQQNNILIFLLILYQRITASSSFAVLNTLRKRLDFLNSEDSPNIAEETSDYSSDFDMDSTDELLKERIWKDTQEMKAEKNFLQDCISLAEIISDSYADEKFSKLLHIIDEIKRREKNPLLKFIVFTEFKATQAALIDFLKKYGFTCACINGDLSRQEKIEQIELFRKESQILVSTDAGGEGINLQFCYCMINFDLPWNPTRIEQRIGRIDRIGQNRNVLVFNFQLADTIDDYVRNTLELKLELIREQFGEDKYSDVITLLNDEFSFEKIYLDALILKERESNLLEIQASEIYEKAKKILEKDELVLPFTRFQKNPELLLQKQTNSLVKMLIELYLKDRNFEMNEYKHKQGVYYFDSPFENKKYRNIIFRLNINDGSEQYEMINVNHEFINNVRREFTAGKGLVASFAVTSDKFKGSKGILILFDFEVKNNVDRHYKSIIPIFLENGVRYNRRISLYLQNLEDKKLENYPVEANIPDSWESIFNNSKEIASESAMELYFKKKNKWIEKIDKYELKAREYFEMKKKSIEDVPIENIRESKLRQLQNDYFAEIKELTKKKMIVPKLALSQVCLIEIK